MKTLTVKVTFLEEMLGMSPSDANINAEYIAANAGNESKANEENSAISRAIKPEDTETEDCPEIDNVPMTIFPKDEDGDPILWDYQIKGFFKDSCGMLRRIPKTACSKIKSYKKILDGLIFPQPRMIKIHLPAGEKIGYCKRPLRASTAQGERIALAKSETVPAGSWLEFDLLIMCDDAEDFIIECLEYGKLRGMGQWRNSGKGRFEYSISK